MKKEAIVLLGISVINLLLSVISSAYDRPFSCFVFGGIGIFFGMAAIGSYKTYREIEERSRRLNRLMGR